MVESISLMFYLITSVTYSFSALMVFLVSYFAFRAYKMTKNKTHLFLFLSFFVLGLGLISLSAVSIYIYTTWTLYKGSSVSINLISYRGFTAYYIFSAISYILLTFIYLPKKFKMKLPILYVPLWYADSENFHIFSLILVGYVVFRSIINSVKKRNLDSYFVTFAFVSFFIFHLLLLLTPFSQNMYIIANAFLIIGSLSLLLMLIRVNVK